MKHLLLLLEDAPPSQAGLAGSTGFKAVKIYRQKRFAPDGNELEWQFLLQGRCRSLVNVCLSLQENCGYLLAMLTPIGLLINSWSWQEVKTLEAAQKWLHQINLLSLGVHIDPSGTEVDDRFYTARQCCFSMDIK